MWNQQRIRSADPKEHRISYGCINVPAKFYQGVVQPSFEADDGGVVYILPDTKPLEDVFPNVRLLPYIEPDQTVVAASDS